MPPETTRPSRLESIAFYLLLAGAVLAPLAFWPSQYFALEAVKSVTIGVLTLASAALLAILSLKRREATLPPKSIVTIGVLMAVSIVASAVASGHFVKSFFGQGFELGAGSFIAALMVAGLVAFMAVAKRADRAIVLYAGMFGAYILLWVVQMLRLIPALAGMSLGVLDSVTASLAGGWFSFGILSAVILVISFSATAFLRLTGRMKAAYWALFAASAIALFLVNSKQVWEALALVFLGLVIYMTSQRARPQGGAIAAFFRRLAWVPLVVCAATAVMAWQGIAIAGPAISKVGAGYTEIVMPWRMTMDVAAGELKDQPLLGSGPNRFSQAFLAYKPAGINTTDAWGVEFNSGFGLLPTFVVTQGVIGAILWVLFLVFFGMLGVKSLRRLGTADGAGSIIEPERPYARFVIISSYAAAALVWLMSIIYVPAHAVVYYGFALTGIWLGTSVAYGRLKPLSVAGRPGASSSKIMPIAAAIALVVAVLWGLSFMKDSAALAYFGQGVDRLTVAADPVAADQSFMKALSLNPLDVYWQARAEAGISLANQLLSGITATSTASTSSAIVAQAGDVVNKAIGYTNSAIQSDPQNYNNYVSQARVAELAAAMKMQKAYETAVAAYTNAIRLNPGNPSLYLALARLHASQNKLDEATQAVGASLQVKQNYLDAVYLLSQIEAAKGNLADAVTAAQFAVQLNPQNPLLYFQLGLLQYNKGDYAASADSFAGALKLAPTYANAQYFLGLADARIGKTADSIAQFEALAQANPDNKEIPLILSALRAGKPLFASGPQAQAARPEKRSTPPIPQR